MTGKRGKVNEHLSFTGKEDSRGTDGCVGSVSATHVWEEREGNRVLPGRIGVLGKKKVL